MDNENKKIIKQKSDLWTVPNILTYLRFALVVPFVILFLNEKYLESAICIGLSGISDCLDGFFARKLNQVTQLGKLLDPWIPTNSCTRPANFRHGGGGGSRTRVRKYSARKIYVCIRFH